MARTPGIAGTTSTPRQSNTPPIPFVPSLTSGTLQTRRLTPSQEQAPVTGRVRFPAANHPTMALDIIVVEPMFQHTSTHSPDADNAPLSESPAAGFDSLAWENELGKACGGPLAPMCPKRVMLRCRKA